MIWTVLDSSAETGQRNKTETHSTSVVQSCRKSTALALLKYEGMGCGAGRSTLQKGSPSWKKISTWLDKATAPAALRTAQLLISFWETLTPKFILYLFDVYMCCLHSTSAEVRRYLSHTQWILHEHYLSKKNLKCLLWHTLVMQYE